VNPNAKTRSDQMIRARPMGERSLFDEFLDGFYDVQRRMRNRPRDVWHPPTDVYETDDDIVIKMSIPGVNPSDVEINCSGKALTIWGRRECANPGEVRTYHQIEIRNGRFERHIAINRPFDPTGAYGEYRDGFLYVYVPKAPESRRVGVSIRIEL